MSELKKNITIHLDERQTIVELAQLLHPFKSEIYIINRSGGNVIEANVKSLLGLVSMRIQNGDSVTVRAIGPDAEEALNEIIHFLT